MARNEKKPAAPGDDAVRERVEELTWALVDDQLKDDEFRLLDSLLLSDDGARDTYVNCIQLHTDLMFHYGNPLVKMSQDGKSPVLGFLAEAMPPTSVRPPVSGA